MTMMMSAVMLVAAAGCAARGGEAIPAETPNPPLTADAVRAEVRRANGWDRLRESTTGLKLTGHATFLGLDEPTTVLMDFSGSCVIELVGQVPYTQGQGPSGPWMLDIGGELRGLALGEAERMITQAQAIGPSWAFDGSPMALTVDQAATTDATVVLSYRLRSPDGTPAHTTGRVEIDRATWRPTRWTTGDGESSDVFELGGELRIGGAWLPATIRNTGRASVITYRFAAAEALPTFLRSPFEPPRALTERPTDVRFDASVPAELETQKAPTGHTLVKVRVQGAEGWFIFDTGAGGTVIDSAFARSVGLQTFGQVSAVGVGGAVPAAFTRAQTLTVGPATLIDSLMTSLDLSAIAKAMGVRVDGVLGYSLMHRAITKLDPERGAVWVYDPATFDGAGLEWHRLIVYERHACVEGEFEGHRGVFKLDTGAGRQPVSIHAPAVSRWKLLDGRETTESRAGGVGGFVPMRRGTLAWLEVGGRREEGVEATFAVEARGAFADEFTLGNLSPRQLGPRDMIFDYVGGRIAFPDRAGEK